MKRLFLFALIAGLVTAGGVRAADSADSRVQVVFNHPDKFTDIKYDANDNDSGRDFILSELHDFVVKTAGRDLPAGDKLTLVFNDITLAGQIQPWHPAGSNNTRVYRSAYAPDFKFSYTITDQSGAVVKQGNEDLRDSNYKDRLLPAGADQDTLPYEKDLLRSWLDSNLTDVKPS
jgi:hypothetical protein